MNILTVKRLPETEQEMDIIKEFFGEVVFNLYDENGYEPIGFRSATSLEVKFINELQEIMMKQQIKPEQAFTPTDGFEYKSNN
jgi:predicted HTH domain antitoxin